LGYGDPKQLAQAECPSEEVGRMIFATITSLRKKSEDAK